MWIIGETMQAINLDGIIEAIPVCPICGAPIYDSQDCMIASSDGFLFLVHYECGDVEYYDA